MKKLISISVTFLALISLVACSSDSSSSNQHSNSGSSKSATSSLISSATSSPVAIDYPNETDFEVALNSGQDMTGKTVTVTVATLDPSSQFGYNIEAGQHLNFVSPENPDVKVGDKINLKVTKVASTLGSFIITYTKVQ